MPDLSSRAERDLAELEKLNPRLKEKADAIIDRLDGEPSLGKKLKGALEGKRSARLARTHRIIYLVDADGVYVLTIVARKDSYR